MAEAYDIIVIGAGLCGLAAASALAERARVLVLEREPQPGYHATGRGTAVMQFNQGSQVVQALTRASLAELSGHYREIEDLPLLAPRGLVRVARADQLDQLHRFFDTAGPKPLCRWLDSEEVRLWVPILRPGYAAAGVLEAEVRDIHVGRLMALHQARMEARGARLVCGAEVTTLLRRTNAWQVASEAGTYQAPVVINAAGAWAGQVGAMAGASPLSLTPKRRTALSLSAPPGVDVAGLPMVADIDACFFLKSENGRFKGTPGDDTPCLPSDARPAPLDVAKGVDRLMAAFDLKIGQPDAVWAGLRTFAADGNPVCGFDPRAQGFFWLAGQGETGIQTAPALSRIAADLVEGRIAPAGRHPAVPGLDLADLAPERLSASFA
ncbi:FAD-binding oxidoreductase [Pseudooceanicola sediminis]|uniref:FAD-binding oxidoreductase n=1 Tax=Pseudooceanicola sediminis TaxID=2211117 RepID=A0A399J4M7_9RHOB|nr:FAD-binding oxidoreductase [Pseudooceanicola sediminis]KAA2315555.1 FAD-binding oxidoreductase [Puniceibacterium sp. HSS470]RII40241.1 FAD-binding oxidoreductase [Pseudooceanicola sediminis]|tara:strand:- start:30643 stop:31785 length:1143 start_codon:yes stop_codon:yes gene_type:complete